MLCDGHPGPGQSNFSGQLSHPEMGREGAAAPSSAPAPDSQLAYYPTQLCGMKHNLEGVGSQDAPPRPRPPASRSRPPHLAGPLSLLSPRCTASARAAATRYRPFLGPWRVFSVWPHITSRKGERGGGGTSSPPSTSRFLLSPRGAPPPNSVLAPPCARIPVPQHLPSGPRSHGKVPLAFFGPSQVSSALSWKTRNLSCFRFETQG